MEQFAISAREGCSCTGDKSSGLADLQVQWSFPRHLTGAQTSGERPRSAGTLKPEEA